MFTLHPQLEKDTVLIGDLPLSALLLSKDANYPWCILVPRKQGIEEIHQLESADRQQLLEESCVLSQLMEHLYQPDKMNIAALGNMVPQLHLHHVARYQSDAAWPKPIWGAVDASVYEEKVIAERVLELRDGLKELGLEVGL